MIYSFTIYKEEGPLGTTKTLKNTEDNDLTVLGEVDGVTYVHVPFNTDIPEQYPEINFQEATLTDDIVGSLKRQRFASLKKQILRDTLEDEVGDLYDMVADCMKLVEFNIMLTSRLAADYFGTDALTQETKDTYATRNQTFLNGVDSGEIKIRGSIEDVNELFNRLITRYSKIQTIVDDRYLSELKKVGLVGGQ